MNKQTQIRAQGKKRAQRLRDKRKSQGFTSFSLSLAPPEMKKLEEICVFFAYPTEPYHKSEAIVAMIHRLHAQMPKIEEDLGSCNKCGARLPRGCAGLFKGDSSCFHTRNRIRIFERNNDKGFRNEN